MLYDHTCISHLVFVNKTASKISIRRHFTGFEKDILHPNAVDTTTPAFQHDTRLPPVLQEVQ